MTNIDEELQAAADRGELRSKGNEAYRKALEQTERRWIVMKVQEIAVHQPMTPEQFKDLCEFIRQFTSAELKPPPAAPA